MTILSSLINSPMYLNPTGGVGIGASQSKARKAFAEMTCAHSSANFSPKNRVSEPSTIRFPVEFRDSKCEQIADVTFRTPANVKSSAITARQLEVPNLIVIFLRSCLTEKPQDSWLFH